MQAASIADGTQQIMSPAYLVQYDAKAQHILKSAIYPGWGHIDADNSRGYIWMTLFTVSALGSVISATMTYNAHEDYLQAVGPDLINKRYNDYNTWYKTRNNFLLLCFTSYSLNIIDISVSLP